MATELEGGLVVIHLSSVYWFSSFCFLFLALNPTIWGRSFLPIT